MINIWGQLLERPVIKEQMLPMYPRIITMMHEELDTVKLIFDKGLLGDFQKDIHFPPVAAKLFWIHKLRNRIKISMDELMDLENPVVDTADGKRMQENYAQMIQLFNEEQTRVFNEWALQVPEQCRLNLDKPLLVRDEKMILSLNFDKQLVAILREVKYMNALEIENIPEEALTLFDRMEELTRNISNLNRTIEWYNWLRTKTEPIELKIILDQMEVIDGIIDEVVDTLTWNSDMWETINNIHLKVKDLYDRVYQAQVNLKTVLNTMEKWAIIPLYERREGKKDQLLNLDDRTDRRQKRYNNIKKSADDIAVMLDENYRLFYNLKMPSLETDENEEDGEDVPKPTPVASRKGARKRKAEKDKSPDSSPDGSPKTKKGKESPKAKREKSDSPGGKGSPKAKGGRGKKGKKGGKKIKEPLDAEAAEELEREARLAELKEAEQRARWEGYLEYVDGLVGNIFLKAAMYSIGIFLSEMEVGRKAPLFEIALELYDPYIRFVPSLDNDDENCFYSLMKSLIEDIVAMGEMIPRIAVNKDTLHYRNIIESNVDICDMIKETLSRVQEGTEKAIKYSKDFEKYAYLWLDNRASFLKQFLAYGRLLTEEELDMLAYDAGGIKESPPTIAQFKEQIDLYEDLYQTVNCLMLKLIFQLNNM